MDDFTKELRQRLTMYEKNKISLEQQLKSAQVELIHTMRAIEGIHTLLAAEEKNTARAELDRLSSTATAQLDEIVARLNARKELDPSNLLDVLLYVMRDREAYSLQELAERAGRFGYVFGEKNPLRTVNATLLGAMSATPPKVLKLPDGSWTLPGREAVS